MLCRLKSPVLRAASLLGMASIALLGRPLGAADTDVYTAEERSHWSLRPRSQPAIPLSASGGAAWLSNPIDAFILARLDPVGLWPSPAADRRTLSARLPCSAMRLTAPRP